MKGKNIKQKRKIVCLKGKIITEMLARSRETDMSNVTRPTRH